MTTKGSLEFIFMATAGVNLCWFFRGLSIPVIDGLHFVLIFALKVYTPTNLRATLDNTMSGPV